MAGSSGSNAFNQLATFGNIVAIARRKRKHYCVAVTRGNQMYFGDASSTGNSDSLRPEFFKTSVPSGCTLTLELSSENTPEVKYILLTKQIEHTIQTP